jgi:hypothetical protein
VIHDFSVILLYFFQLRSIFQSKPFFFIPLILFFCIVGMCQPIKSFADFNFAAAGDFGCGSSTDATVTNMRGKNPELVLALGDYSYQATADCWLDSIQSIDSITKINIGNHEDENSTDFNKYMDHFGLTLPYYSFNYQNVHVLTMMYERTGYSPNSTQYDFILNDLQAASQNPNIDWIIVSVHEWLYKASSHNPHNDDLTEVYHPLFDQYGVDLVLSGHDHNYHRTYPIKYNPSNPTRPIITNNNPNDYIDPQGQIYAVVGTGGINLGPINGSSPFVASAQDDFFGQLDIRITNDGNKLEGRFYRNGNNAILDNFSITRGPDSPPVANNQTVSIIKNTPTLMSLTATDPNNDPLIYSIVQRPSNGTISGGNEAARTYTPNTGFTGSDSFTFKAHGGTADSNTATVTMSVIKTPQGSFYYAPSLALMGSNYDDTASSTALNLSQFSVAAWFKTSTNFVSRAYIVNKGGSGSDSAGQNLNYGIWMTSSEKLQAGFEAVGGAAQFVTSPNTYNDGQWHYAVVTYDGSNLILFIDGAQVSTKSISGSSPETSGTKPVRVGANSRVTPPGNFFTGEVDEVRVWNDDLTAKQIADAFAGTSFNTAEQVLHLQFSGGVGHGGYN